MSECTPQSNDSQTIPTVLSNATRAIHGVLAANGYSGDYVFHGGTARYLYGDASITPDSVGVLFLRPTHTLSLKQLIPVFDSKHFEYIRDGQKLLWRPSNDGEPVEIIFTPPSSTYNSSEICSIRDCPVPPYPYILLSSLWGWAQLRQGVSLARPELERELQECAAAKDILSMLSFLCSWPELVTARPPKFFDKVLRDTCESVVEAFSKQYPSTTKVWKRLGFGPDRGMEGETVSPSETTTARPSLALIQASILTRSRQQDPTLASCISKQLPNPNTHTSSTSTSQIGHPRCSSETSNPITSKPSTTNASALTNINSAGTPRNGTESTQREGRDGGNTPSGCTSSSQAGDKPLMARASQKGKSKATTKRVEKTDEKEEKSRDGTGTAGVKNLHNSAISSDETPYKSTTTASTSTRTWTDKRTRGSSDGTLHASHTANAKSSYYQQSNTTTSHSHPQTGSLNATGSKPTTSNTSATIRMNIAGTARNTENATWKGEKSNRSGTKSGGTQRSEKGQGRTAGLNQKGKGKENANGGGKKATKRYENKKAIGGPTISSVKATVNDPTTTAFVSTKPSNGASSASNNPCSSADKAGGGSTSTNVKNTTGRAFTSNSTTHRPKTARSSPPPFYSSQFDSWVLKHYTCFYDS